MPIDSSLDLMQAGCADSRDNGSQKACRIGGLRERRISLLAAVLMGLSVSFAESAHFLKLGELNNAAVGHGASDGFRYYITMNPGFVGDTGGEPFRSPLVLLENGIALGPEHHLHAEIASLGHGRYSHWSSVLYFSASDNTDPRLNGKKYEYGVFVSSEANVQGALTASEMTTDQGFSYLVSKNFGAAGDSAGDPTWSLLRIFENGVELEKAHSLHADIRNAGLGRFSHWGNTLRFSATDNSDPRTNGRAYTYGYWEIVRLGVINAASSMPDGSIANSFVLTQDFGFSGDTTAEPWRSPLVVLENGVRIGPAHNTVAGGAGRFSHRSPGLNFSSSDNTDPRTNGRRYEYGIRTGTGTNVQGALMTASMASDTGYAYYGAKNFKTPGDAAGQTARSIVRIFENGKELGAAHSSHADIRNIGLGRFSHWGDTIRASASDNTDLRQNGRAYTFGLGKLVTLGNVNAAQATHGANDGFSYYVAQNFGFVGNILGDSGRSKLVILEDGKPLESPHSAYVDIAAQGKGRYNHWGGGLYFSSSDNTDPRTNGRSYEFGVYADRSADMQGVIDTTIMPAGTGFAYGTSQGLGVSGDTSTYPAQSSVRIFENGVEIGPAHSAYSHIRDLGAGRFTHWGTMVYFSSSDNTDPRTNGRLYTYAMNVGPSPLTVAAVGQVAPANIANNPTWFVVDYPYVYSICKGSYTAANNDRSVLDVFEIRDGRAQLLTSSVVGTAGVQVRGLEYYKNTLYLADISGRILIYSIADRTVTPTYVSQFTAPSGGWSQVIHVINNILCLPQWNGRIDFYSLQQPTSPSYLKSFNLSATSGPLVQMIPYGDYVWCIGYASVVTQQNLHCFDLRNTANPQLVSSSVIPDLKYARYGVIESGILYAGGFAAESRVCAINVQNSLLPTLVKKFDFNLSSLVKDGNYLIGPDFDAKDSKMVDITNINSPVISRYFPEPLYYPKVLGGSLFAFKAGSLVKPPQAAPNDSANGDTIFASEPMW